ncbi:unnamed protein product [Closterium sp. NIES-54]
MTSCKEWFKVIRDPSATKYVKEFDGSMKEVAGVGLHVTLHDVLFVPWLKGNLVSPRQLTDKGADMQTKEGVTRIITSGGQVAATARYRLRVLCLDLKPWPASNGTAVVVACNGMAAAAACNGMAAAMSCMYLEEGGKEMPCTSCQEANLTRQSFPLHDEREGQVLGLVHTDVCGPFQTLATDGSRYYILFVDHTSRYTWGKTLKLKSDALAAFKEWLPEAECQTGMTLKVLRSDWGGEFMSKEFLLLLKH